MASTQQQSSIIDPRVLEEFQKVYDRFSEIERQLADPEIIQNSTLYANYLKERGRMAKSAAKYAEFAELRKRRAEAEAILNDPSADRELVELAEMELEELAEQEERAYEELLDVFILSAADMNRNAIVEIRAGTGGEEAALFAGDLFRMYVRYAERKGWKCDVVHRNDSDLGGYKEIVFVVEGEEALLHLECESGTHRVQRVPETEAYGRIHTSAATVSVLPEAEDVDVDIEDKDLEIEAFRASGPGGQHVNKTSSAVRIRHKPTGIVVTCQDERSYHKNRAKAMRVLRTRLLEARKQEEESARSEMRRKQVGSGDRSEKIRTYNFPENRVTDHRIKLTLYKLQDILMGDLDDLVRPLIEWRKAQRIQELLPTLSQEARRRGAEHVRFQTSS